MGHEEPGAYGDCAAYRLGVRFGAGVLCVISGDTALYRDNGGDVLCQRYDGSDL